MTLTTLRQHPVVMQQPERVFKYVADALQAEMLSGMVLQKSITTTKSLLQATGQNPDALLAQYSPEAQETVRRFFS